MIADRHEASLGCEALGHLGQTNKAQAAVRHLESLRPGIDRDFVRSRLFYLKDESQVDTYISGLHKAGLT